NARRCGFGGKWRCRALDRNNHGHAAANQVGGLCWQSFETTLGPAIFDRHVAALDIAGFVETLPDGVKSAGFAVRAAEQPDHRHRRLLRPRRHRPRRCRAAEQRDEVAPPDHSMTSSARASSVAGISRPSALAVGRLMTNWNFVDCTTGKSAALAPLRI